MLWTVPLLAVPSVAWAGATVWVPVGVEVVARSAPDVPEDPAVRARYPAWNAIDGDPATTFVVPAGKVLRLELGGQPRVHRVELVPGYAKSAQTWHNNRRITRARARTLRGTQATPWVTVDLDPPDRLAPGEPPWLGLDLEPLAADVVELEVLASEAGATSSDVCLSEVVLLSRDDQPPPPTVYRASEAHRDALPFERLELMGTRRGPRLVDRTCARLEHDLTGGAQQVFVGRCTVSARELRLAGVLEVRAPPQVTRTPLNRAYAFQRVNARVVLVDGRPFTR